MLAEVGSSAYNLFLLLHLLTAIAGFGGLIAMGILGTRAASQGGREGAAVFEYVVTSRWAEWIVYSVPIFGIIVLLLSGDAFKFSQTWISLSFLLFIAYVGVLHGAHLPNLRSMNSLMAELGAGERSPGGGRPPGAAELGERTKRAGLFGAILNLILIALIVLMVWKPGYPS